MNSKFNITILIAPLDWGLGHAARCVPLIHYLHSLGCTVIIATGGAQEQLLRIEFPSNTFLPLFGYEIKYAQTKRWFVLKILWQVPKILKAIKKEHRWLKTVVTEHRIDAVISDNRYGLWHPQIISIFMTHQLQVKAPTVIENRVRKMNYSFINRFSYCWVPDVKGVPNLSGTLSHPVLLPKISVTYIGGLSRFDVKEVVQKQFDLLIVISGPEPQRSLLENNLLKSLENYTGKVLLVRGLPGSRDVLASFKDITIINHLAAKEMCLAFMQSDLIISRSGYTTVMDIIKLGKKSILIPTPGQTEQEYLANHLHQQKWCLYFTQNNFDLPTALKEAASFSYQLPHLTMEEYKIALNDLVSSLNS